MNKDKNCCCYISSTNETDGCPYEYCLFYCDTEFECSMCDHTYMEKHLVVENQELRNDLLKNKIDKNRLRQLEEENLSMKKEIKQLQEDCRTKDLLLENKEINIAEFAEKNSKYVKNLKKFY